MTFCGIRIRTCQVEKRQGQQNRCKSGIIFTEREGRERRERERGVGRKEGREGRSQEVQREPSVNAERAGGVPHRGECNNERTMQGTGFLSSKFTLTSRNRNMSRATETPKE